LDEVRKPRSKTIPKSFRIDESASKAVEDEAAAQDISANTLVNQILKQFAEFDRFANKIDTVKLSGSILRSILDNIEPDKIVQVAKSAGSSIPQAFVMSKTGRVELNSLLEFIRSSAQYAHQYEFNETIDTRGRSITLVHDLGLNWSIFLVHYVTAMLELVGTSPKIEMSDRSVTFTLTTH
jgi:hypothetical protein